MTTPVIIIAGGNFIVGGVTSTELEEEIWETAALVTVVSLLSDIPVVTTSARLTRIGKHLSRSGRMLSGNARKKNQPYTKAANQGGDKEGEQCNNYRLAGTTWLRSFSR